MIRIDRCVCFELPFEELKEVALSAHVTSLEELQQHVTFGAQCGLCRPYVRRMLKTGRTVFNELISDNEESD